MCMSDLNPSLSALVVTAHVKDGLEIAEQEHLPPVIKAFITEHHGTSLIRYFYHQQTGGEGGEAGLEQHFPVQCGPKPQSRETAILDAGGRSGGGVAHAGQAHRRAHRRFSRQDYRRDNSPTVNWTNAN